ncbi:MAG: ABC transporter permease [Lentisphaeria bacterium]
MILPTDIFLAKRYLRPKRTFVSVITILSILGPALGVTVLIVVTSLMSGFDRDIKQRILDTQADLQVKPLFSRDQRNTATIKDPGPVLDKMEEIGVTGAPLIEGPVLLQHKDAMQIQYMRGVIPELEKQVTNVRENVTGKFKIEEGEAIIGARMAENLGVNIGDSILIHSPYKLTRNIKWQEDGEVKITEPDEVYLPEEVTIAGIFRMGVYEFDSTMIYLHLDQAATLMGMDWGSATSIHARTGDPFNLTAETEALQNAFPYYNIITWQEANSVLFGALQNEKTMMLFILFVIVIVAAFCISATLITVVTHKTREIAVMKATGIGAFTITRVFVIQGAFIGFAGTLLGAVMGVSLVHYRTRVAGLIAKVMGRDIFPPQLYHLDEIPGMIKFGDISLILVVAFVICVSASLLPALYASCLSTVQALQDEN